MGLMDTIRNIDLDNLLSYQTVKFVKIRDRRLGGIHYLLQLGIALYIIVYTIIIQQRYLRTEIPNGSIRATVQEPDQWIPANTLQYCAQNSSHYNGFPNNPCVYMLGLDLSYPPALMDSIFVSTRIKDTFYPIQANNCVGNLPLTIECAPLVANASAVRYYTAGIEDYTIYMEHAIFGRQSNIMVSNTDCVGQLRFRDGTDPIKFSDPERGGDIVTMRTIINAANVASLDIASHVPDSAGSLRYDGVFIVALVTYSNNVRHPRELVYNYELYQIPLVNVISMEPSVGVAGGISQRSWYGIRVIFLIGGSIGTFDFPTLLTSLVNGLILVKLATVIVDMLLLYVMPDKVIYTKHKFEVTEDFSDLRRTTKHQKEQSSLEVRSIDEQP